MNDKRLAELLEIPPPEEEWAKEAITLTTELMRDLYDPALSNASRAKTAGNVSFRLMLICNQGVKYAKE